MSRRAAGGWAVALAALTLSLAPSAALAAPRPVPFMRAMTMVEWGPTAFAPGPTRRLLDRLRARQHVDTVLIPVVWDQRTGSSTRIAPGPETAPAGRVREAIRLARARHLRVVLRPYVDPDDGSWRGAITPTSVNAWFASYRRYILGMAELAQRSHVSGLIVGSEMNTMTSYAGRWRSLVAAVRRRFHGFLSYESNWDQFSRLSWWNALDAVSISAYFPLSNDPLPTTASLVAGWSDYVDPAGQQSHWLASVQAIAAATSRPVIFSEIGYRPIVAGAATPWDPFSPAARAPAVQANAYAAAFQVFYRLPWFRGFAWWFMYPQHALLAGKPGADYAPTAGALAVLAHWYAHRP